MFDNFLATVTDFFSRDDGNGSDIKSGPQPTSSTSALTSAACCTGARDKVHSPGIVARGVDADAIESPRDRRQANNSGKIGLRSFLRLFGRRSESPRRKKIEREKRQRQRGLIISELIETEKDYVRDLRILIDVFYTPLKAKAVLKKEKSVSSIFSPISLMLNVNVELLASLQKVDSPTLDTVCDAFLEIIPYFKMYSTFVDSFEKTCAQIAKLRRTKPKFRKFLERCLEDPQTRGLDLESFMIKPVQRLLKYPLFFRDLLRKTRRRNPAYQKLERVQTMMENVASSVNEKTRDRQALEQAFSIISEIESTSAKATIALRQRLTEAHRKLKCFTQGTQLVGRGKDPRYSLAVFSDIVLLLQERKRKHHMKAEADLGRLVWTWTWTDQGLRFLISEHSDMGSLVPFVILFCDAIEEEDEYDGSRIQQENGDKGAKSLDASWAHSPTICLSSSAEISDIETTLARTREVYLRTKSDLEQRTNSSPAQHKESDVRRWLKMSRGDLKSIADLRRRYIRKMSSG